ncbi:MAG: hypothetical protein JW931_04635 [Methanomicrobiaceae archaeon]|nr:hypothetical protein [Methanomicrobiaceae archaeon]
MRVISFLSAMVSLSALLKTAYDRLYAAEGVPADIESPLHVQFRKTIESMEKFLESIYIVFGSSVLGMIIDPPDPLWQADQVFNEFLRNYREFIGEFSKLVSEIRNSGEDVRKKLGGEWVTLDTVGRLLEKGKVEWDDVASEGALRSADPILNNQRRFNNHLTDRFRKFLSDEMEIHDFEPLDLVSSLIRENEIINITGARLMQLISDTKRE